MNLAPIKLSTGISRIFMYEDLKALYYEVLVRRRKISRVAHGHNGIIYVTLESIWSIYDLHPDRQMIVLRPEKL